MRLSVQVASISYAAVCFQVSRGLEKTANHINSYPIHY
uniref:Uncharacterized protein n=1 Tax=Anguilla anguilla TaxID=7936 RepID=A0A0E9VXZ4_ANGAN